MKKIFYKFTGIALLPLLLLGCASMPKQPKDQERGDYSFTREYITRLIKEQMEKENVTGLSIALVDDQRVIWAEGFGFADKANNVPATAETIYRAGSITKLFTATAVMQLADQEKLDIDKPLQTYLPDFSIRSRFPDAGPITPRTIMNHHSGIPTNYLKGMWSKQPEPFQNLVKQISDEYVAAPPNLVFSYSNLGVTLLGHALERVSGQSYAEYLNSSILSPLRMSHSTFSEAPDHSALAAKAYSKDRESEEFPLRDIPAGGLNTTVLDLSRFVQMVFAGGRTSERQIIKTQTLDEMFRPQNDNVPLDFDMRIGLAWGIRSNDINNGGMRVGHNGATLYHRSELTLLLDHKLGVVVLSNSSSAGSVVNKVATETLKLALLAKTGIQQPEKKTELPAVVSRTPEELQAHEGIFETLGGVVRVRSESDHLRVEMMKKDLYLWPRTDSRFYLQYKLLGLIPISLGNLDNLGISLEKIDGLEILKGKMIDRELLIGERIQPVPISEKWLQRLGDYEIVNPGNDATLLDKVHLRLDNGILLLDYQLPLFATDILTLALRPISDFEAIIYGIGRRKGETIQTVDAGQNELLLYSGYLLRKKLE